MPNKRPLVSFIVASYNYERFIGTTLKSILHQTVQDFEIVVIDDGSTDASLDVIRSFCDPRIHLHVNDKNLGIVSTYNKGVSLANGEYITWLDSDDWIEPRKIEEQLEFFRRNPDVDIVGTYVKFYDKEGNRYALADNIESFFNQPYDFNSIEAWIGDNKLHASSVLIVRSVFDRIGVRDDTITVASDYEFWRRAHARGCRFGMVDIPLLCYRIHGDNASGRDPVTTLLEASFVLQNVVLPTIEKSSALHLIPAVTGWIVANMQSSLLGERQRYRLLELLAGSQKYTNCADFKRAVLSDDNFEYMS